MLFKIPFEILFLLLNLSKCFGQIIHLALNEIQFKSALEIVNPGDTIQLGSYVTYLDWYGRFEITRNGTPQDPIKLDIVANIIFFSDPNDKGSETLFTIRASHWIIVGQRLYLIPNSQRQPALQFLDAHYNYFSKIDLIVSTIIENQIGFSMENSNFNTINLLKIDQEGDGLGLSLEKCSENLFNSIQCSQELWPWDTYGRVQIRNSHQNQIKSGHGFSLTFISISENLIENSDLVSLTIDSDTNTNDYISTKNLVRNNKFNYNWTRQGQADIPKFAIELRNSSCCGVIEGNLFSGLSSKYPLNSFISIDGQDYVISHNVGETLGGFGFFLGDSVNHVIFRNNSLTIVNPQKYCIHGNPLVHSGVSVCIEPGNSCVFAQLSNFESGFCSYNDETPSTKKTSYLILLYILPSVLLLILMIIFVIYRLSQIKTLKHLSY